LLKVTYAGSAFCAPCFLDSPEKKVILEKKEASMATTTYINGHVFTGEGFTDGFTIRDGFFAVPEEDCKRVDLKGACVLPGFIDSHTHLIPAGLYALGADLSGAISLDEVFSRIESALASPMTAQPFACLFDETRLKENRFPTLRELDDVTGTTPFYMTRIDLHSMMVNTAFMKKYGMKGTSPLIRGRDYDLMVRRLGQEVPFGDKKRGLLEMEKKAFKAGVTALHTMEGVEDDFSNIDALLELQGQTPLGILLYPQVMDLQGVLERGLPRIGGCILIDGSLGSRTAALSAPYYDAPGETGRLYLDDEALFSFMRRVHEAGLQMSFHAIGDRAVRQLVRGYSLLGREAEKRHRIEHAILVQDEDLETIARLGLWLDFQPMFHEFWGKPGGLYEQRLGKERARQVNRIRTAAEKGIPFAFGSDCNVTPLDPLGGIAAAVSHPVPGERLSVEEAVRAFTLYAARIGHTENLQGSIFPGKKADFVVLSGNIFSEEDIRKVTVRETYIAGECVYRAEDHQESV